MAGSAPAVDGPKFPFLDFIVDAWQENSAQLAYSVSDRRIQASTDAIKQRPAIRQKNER
jgi:hypothetical protein